jgi:signal transduction histidine kinase
LRFAFRPPNRMKVLIMKLDPHHNTLILLVDDEPGLRKVLGIALTDLGYQVIMAPDGKEALRLFEFRLPPIVLSDVKMPGMSGIELLRAIKRFRPETEVIMITGHGDMDLAIRSLKFEATDFITKPIRDDALEIALKRAHERIALRDQLRQYTENLEQLVAEKTRKLLDAERMAAVGQTVAGISHSIKNIAGGLTGGAFVVEKGFELDDPRYLRQGWRMVRGNVEKIARLSLDLLNYTRSAKINIQKCDPNGPAREVVELMQPRAEEEGVALNIQLDKNLKPLYCDPDAVHLALLNLVTNALDACCEGGGGGPSVSLTSSRPPGWGVEYRVCDTGCGMDDNTREKLFQAFFTTKGSRGTGIGLMMTLNVIEKHGGTITVRSKEGTGSEFIIRLPELSPQPEKDPLHDPNVEMEGEA